MVVMKCLCGATSSESFECKNCLAEAKKEKTINNRKKEMKKQEE